MNAYLFAPNGVLIDSQYFDTLEAAWEWFHEVGEVGWTLNIDDDEGHPLKEWGL